MSPGAAAAARQRLKSNGPDPRRPVPRPVFRWLRAFAFDPSRGKNYGNYMMLQVLFEHPLSPGQVGSYLAVFDYDHGNQCDYESIYLYDSWILSNPSMAPT